MYNDNLDIVLIFSGLFSAVSTTFIQGMVDDLEPDPNETTNALLQIIAHSLNASLFPDPPEQPLSWDGPDSLTVWTQCILYASLAASLLAALGGVLGKQWLNYYARLEERGSTDARCRSRQQKLYGIDRWRFRGVIECLPLLLQASLLLFGIGMSSFIWSRQSTIGAVIIGATSLGVLFYVFIVMASLISPYCPFQTPVAEAIKKITPFLARGWAGSVNGYYTWLDPSRMDMFIYRRLQSFSGSPDIIHLIATPFIVMQYMMVRVVETIVDSARSVLASSRHFDSWFDQERKDKFIADRVVIPRSGNKASAVWVFITRQLMVISYLWTRILEQLKGKKSSSAKLALGFTSLAPPQSDAMTVSWILQSFTEPSVITTAAQMVLEIEWPPDIDVFPVFYQLFYSFVDCLPSIRNHDVPVMVRERANATGKALLHLLIERLTLGDNLMDKLLSWDINAPSRVYAVHPWGEGDVVGMYLLLEHWIASANTSDAYFLQRDRVLHFFCGSTPSPWKAHLIPHIAYNHKTIVYDEAVDNFPGTLYGAFEDIACTLSNGASLPDLVLADLLLAAAFLLGCRVDKRDLLKLDKSQHVDQILDVLITTFPQAYTGATDTRRPRILTLLGLVHPIYMHRVPRNIEIADGFPLWCLWLSKQCASKDQVQPFKHLRDGKLVPFTGTATSWALELCVRAASAPYSQGSHRWMWSLFVGLEETPNSSFRYRGGEVIDFAEWLLGFIHSLRGRCDKIDARSSIAASVVKTDIAHALLALSGLTVKNTLVAEDINSRLVDNIQWAMDTNQPTLLRNAALKLFRDLIRHKIHGANIASSTNERLLVKLRSTIEEPAQGQETVQVDSDRDEAFMTIVSTIAKSIPASSQPLFESVIPSCVKIVRAHIDSLTTLRTSLIDAAIVLFVYQGLLPDEEDFMNQMHDIAWKSYCDSDEYSFPFMGYFCPIIARPPSESPCDDRKVFRFQQRLDFAMAWLEYCHERFARGLDGSPRQRWSEQDIAAKDWGQVRDGLERLRQMGGRSRGLLATRFGDVDVFGGTLTRDEDTDK
ncbi:hypothetical protein HGRIS_002009 [Hohenbuehelia grisea]